MITWSLYYAYSIFSYFKDVYLVNNMETWLTSAVLDMAERRNNIYRIIIICIILY